MRRMDVNATASGYDPRDCRASMGGRVVGGRVVDGGRVPDGYLLGTLMD